MDNQVTYKANGTTTEFSFNFKVFKPENLEIYINGLKQEGGYHTELSDDYGQIIFSIPPALNSKIVIKRNLKIVRQTDLQEYGVISAQDLNLDMDYIVELIRQTNEELKKCIKYDPEKGEIKTTLPQAEAKKAIVWDETAKRLVNSEIDFLDESLSAEKTYEDIKIIFEDMKKLLNNSNDGSCYGLVVNMIDLLKAKFPELSQDLGTIMEAYNESEDYGNI